MIEPPLPNAANFRYKQPASFYQQEKLARMNRIF